MEHQKKVYSDGVQHREISYIFFMIWFPKGWSGIQLLGRPPVRRSVCPFVKLPSAYIKNLY